jgi:hypothetical protein
MPFTVNVYKYEDCVDGNHTTQLYSQTVEVIDLVKVIEAVNATPPPTAKPKKRRSDAGKPRAPKPEPVVA